MNCAFAHLDVLICVHHSNILRWGALWTICWGNTLSTWTLFRSNGFPMSQISNFWTFEPWTANMWTKNHIFFTLHTIPESEQAHYYMEDRDINIPESIFESPLLQIALENVPCPRCATFFSEAFSGWKIFTSSKKALHPQRVLELSAKREIIQWIQHSWSNIIQKLRPWNVQCQFPNDISFRPVLAKIGFHPDVLAPPPPCQVLLVLHHQRKRRGKKGKKRPTYSSTKCPK